MRLLTSFAILSLALFACEGREPTGTQPNSSDDSAGGIGVSVPIETRPGSAPTEPAPEIDPVEGQTPDAGNAADAGSATSPDAVSPPSPDGQGGPPPGNGPEQRSLVLWTSDDGLTFEEGIVLLEKADVPSVAEAEDGHLVVAFQTFIGQPSDPDYDKVGFLESFDGGSSWSDVMYLNLPAYPADEQRPFDPTITWDPDAEHWRLFFSASPQPGTMLNPDVCTHTAHTDGASLDTFVYDGVSFCDEETDEPVIDPAVIKIEGTWFYIAPKGPPQDGAHMAQSADGVTFEANNPILVDDNKHVWAGNLANEDGILHFYGPEANIPDGVGTEVFFRITSTDQGVSWSMPERTTLDANNGIRKDPGVLFTSNRDWMMVVPTLPSP